MLYIVATPIGNLQDLTFRALETLKSVDEIYCEDTRTSSILLKHYGVQKPLSSFHKFNEASRLEETLEALRSGRNIALISDAGTPGIADPGAKLIRTCHKNQLPVAIIPGPSALSAAMGFAGIVHVRTQFCGFLEKKEGKLKEQLIDALLYEGTTLFYDSPHHLPKTLALLNTLQRERNVTLIREMTKIHEELLTLTPKEMLKHFQSYPLKGELVLLIEGEKMQTREDPKAVMEELMETFQLSKKEAMKLAAEICGIPKRELYAKEHLE